MSARQPPATRVVFDLSHSILTSRNLLRGELWQCGCQPAVFTVTSEFRKIYSGIAGPPSRGNTAGPMEVFRLSVHDQRLGDHIVQRLSSGREGRNNKAD